MPLERANLSEATRHRVLIVDDHPDGAEVMRIALGLEGHDARVAHDGPAALALALQFQPSVVLLDIGLPVMDGYEVARRLRAIPGGAEMLLVAVSGYRKSDEGPSKRSDFDAHLLKPVDFGALSSLLNRGKRDEGGA